MPAKAGGAQLTRALLKTEGRVAVVTLENPPLNVIDLAMIAELSGAIAGLEARPDISVMILTGAGKTFSAGVDVAAHTPDKVRTMLTEFHSLIRALTSTKKITVASVHGHCLGGGAELAMVCDLVYSAEDAQWGFPEIKLGCYPPVAATALASLIGQKRAAELILTGRTLSGREAALIGLATRAVPGEDLERAGREIAAQLADLSPIALALAKKVGFAPNAAHLEKGLVRAEEIYFEELIKTRDAEEGVRAFMEKRPPRWEGK